MKPSIVNVELTKDEETMLAYFRQMSERRRGETLAVAARDVERNRAKCLQNSAPRQTMRLITSFGKALTA